MQTRSRDSSDRDISWRAALVSQGIRFAYYQLIEWVDLFPWNDIRRGKGQATLDIVVGGIMLALLLASDLIPPLCAATEPRPEGRGAPA